jgi:catechol 2,3-dioxygenase
MSERPEPRHDIAHLGHVELLTPRPDESLWYFRDVLGMSEVAREGQSVYLRAWGEYELASLKLTEAQLPGVAHTAFRAESPQALARLVADLETSGLGRGWTPGDIGHGAAYQFTDPDGHQQEVYYETVRYQAPMDQQPALKNQP